MFWFDVAAAAIPAMIIACLFLGVAYSFEYPDWRLLWFLVSFLASGALSMTAGHFDGIQAVLQPFLFGQFAFLVFLVIRLKGARLPAFFLALFFAANAWATAFFVELATVSHWYL